MYQNLLLLIIAACVCGSYRNISKHPEPYTENLAKAVDSQKNEMEYPIPHLLQGYEAIITGKNVPDMLSRFLNLEPNMFSRQCNLRLSKYYINVFS